MIVSFMHKGLRRFFETGNLSGIQPAHAKRLGALLTLLDTAITVKEMDISGCAFTPSRGFTPTRWSVHVSANWRLTFDFHDGDAYVVDYEDYH